MPCAERRGCAKRFAGVSAPELRAILFYHGHCGGCGKDLHPESGNPTFDIDPARGQLRPLCGNCAARSN